MTKGSMYNLVTEKLKAIQYLVGIIMLISVLGLVFIQVALRYFFNAPLMGIEELLLFPTIWLYMIGGANASEERSHIEVDLVDTFMTNDKVKGILGLIKDLLTSIVGIILSYWTFVFFRYSLTIWKHSALLSIPLFFAESALFIGVFLMTIYSIFDLFKNFKLLRVNFKRNVGEER